MLERVGGLGVVEHLLERLLHPLRLRDSRNCSSWPGLTPKNAVSSEITPSAMPFPDFLLSVAGMHDRISQRTVFAVPLLTISLAKLATLQ